MQSLTTPPTIRPAVEIFRKEPEQGVCYREYLMVLSEDTELLKDSHHDHFSIWTRREKIDEFGGVQRQLSSDLLPSVSNTLSGSVFYLVVSEVVDEFMNYYRFWKNGLSYFATPIVGVRDLL